MLRSVVVTGLLWGWLLALGACPKGQVSESTGESTGGTDASASAGMSTTAAVPTTGTGAGGESSTGALASTGSSGVEASSSGGGGSSSTGAGASTSGSSSTGEVGSSGGAGSTGEAQQLFDCFGCTCDAAVSYCRQVFAGFKGPEPGACPVVPEEGLGSGCVLYPVDCEPPKCDCLPLMNNNCFCNEQGPGEFEVTCPLP
ncbi:MAG: hypothetical protein IPO88_03990 [Nannocystis sp.]|uniref:hypothetical protein n=1 Tax=Nannocystis sp. TaxID=1962667 RepID=UPI002428AEB1|nr:hypothetical protein [Nannocystis sp.]MBK9752662.1 hypothetical protein [Nannocystis sp.]